MSLYPIYIDLRGRRCVVIGGGETAAQKVLELLDAEAAVTVIAPEVDAEIARHAEAGRIVHEARTYREGDLRGVYVALAERLGADFYRRVRCEAERRAVLLNVQDELPYCFFHAPSVVRQGDLTVAISTAGKAPALAARLRRRLSAELGPSYARFLEYAGKLRGALATRVKDFSERRRIWYELVDSDVLSLLEAGDEARARKRIVEVTGLTLQDVSLEEASS